MATLLDANIQVSGVIDDNPCVPAIFDCPVISAAEYFYRTQITGDLVHVAIGNNDIRLEKTEQIVQLGAKLLTVIHPTATIFRGTTVGLGSFIGAACVINSNTIVGESAIVNTGAIVEHDCNIDDYSFIGVRAVVGAGMKVGRHCVIKAGTIPEGHFDLPDNTSTQIGEIYRR